MYAQQMGEGYAHLANTARYQVSCLPFVARAFDGASKGSMNTRCCSMPRGQATSLIGNWLEERELRRSILKDALSKKMTGSLRLDA